MKKLFTVLTFLAAALSSPSLPSSVVFRSGTEGYNTFRIPAIVSTPDGTLLAFAEGRVAGSNDFGNIDIVLKRSTDNGKSWGPMQVVCNFDSLQAGNPAPVVDVTDPAYPGGRVFLFYNTGNNHEGEVRKGKGCREVWYRCSGDAGLTWSDPVNITIQVHRPAQPGYNEAYTFIQDWRSYANTPGHAMQFMQGPYKGRIVVAANHSAGEPDSEWKDYTSHTFFTDDHGKSFSLGKDLGLPGSNEASAAELQGGRLVINARNQRGDIKARIIAESDDGGETWKDLRFDRQLPDPVCEGTILTCSRPGEIPVLAFCNAADTLHRNNLTLRISHDDGKTWPVAIKIDGTRKRKLMHDFTAYSDIVDIPGRRIGVLYERNDYSEIVFRLVTLE